MPVRESLTERKNKITEVSRDSARAYLGANDDLYDRMRRFSLKGQEESPKGIDLREAVKSAKPAKLKETVEKRMDASRRRRQEHVTRGAQLVEDWRQASAVKDAQELIDTVKSADGAGELLKGVRTWLSDYPTWVSAPKAGTATKAAKPRPRKLATTVPAKTASAKTASAKTASAKTASAKRTTARKAPAKSAATKVTPKTVATEVTPKTVATEVTPKTVATEVTPKTAAIQVTPKTDS